MNQSSHNFVYNDSFSSFPLESESVDLVVSSPPYPMIQMWDDIFIRSNTALEQSIVSEPLGAYEAMHQLLDQTWAECNRVVKPGGFICINIGDATRTIEGQFRMYSNHSRIVESFVRLGLDVLPHIIWRKPTNSPTKFMGSGMLPGGAYVTLEHEYILVFRKGGKRVFKESEKLNRSRSAYFWEERNKWFSDQWEILGTRQNLLSNADRKRSGAYPLEVPLRLILMYSAIGDIVLDPFSGTGTSAMAAMLYGRNSLSFDFDKKLINNASTSFKKHGVKEVMNEQIENRLKSHREYVHSKDQLYFTYLNKILQTPVKTIQEKKMEFFPIKSISKEAHTILVNYRKFKKSEIQALNSAQVASSTMSPSS